MLNIDGIFVPSHALGSGLRLKGYEALIYSLIEGFTSNDCGMYCSEKSIAQYLGCRRECVSRAIQSLLRKKLIEQSPTRHKPGNTHCYYVTKSHIGMCEKVTLPGAKKSHNNKRDEKVIIYKQTSYGHIFKSQGADSENTGTAAKKFDGTSRL